MLRNGTAGSLTTTTSAPEQGNERAVKRFRLTLRTDDDSKRQNVTRSSAHAETKMVNGSWKGKSVPLQRERPPGRESPTEEKHSYAMSNGVAAEWGAPGGTPGGASVFGVVQRSGDPEVTARQWPVNYLRDEMHYIREVRDSLEKVRERMYGQFGGMQQTMKKLSQDLQMANYQNRHLEEEVKTGRAALESFDQMNSSLITANIDLQKTLLDGGMDRLGNMEERKTLRESLRERENELAALQAENQALKLQLESSQEKSAQALREMNIKLQHNREKLQEQERKHREEITALQAQLEDYVRRLAEAEAREQRALTQIQEREQRIGELERLLTCMSQEKAELMQKLCECEKQLRSLAADEPDSGSIKKTEQLQKESSELRERIKHLNDMVFCQQRKVKGMIEEVESLRADVVQKDMYISELLDRIAIVECENNEFEDKLKFFMSVQNTVEDKPLTRDIGVGCDLPVSHHIPQTSNLPAPTAPRPSSRLDSSLLRYSPLQYSSMLASYTRDNATSTAENTTSTSSPVRPDHEGETLSSSRNSELSPVTRSDPHRVYTPFMRLMEMTAKLNIE